MASGSLRIREELVWEPDPNYLASPSNIFLLMDSKWQLCIDKSEEFDENSSNIHLINKVKRVFEPFTVSTFIEDARNHIKLQGSTVSVSRSRGVLHKINPDVIHEFGRKEAVIIVHFFPSTGLAVKEDTEDGE